MTTPGYKASIAFQDVLIDSAAAQPTILLSTDFAQGGLRATGLPFDLALSGPGFFSVSSERGGYYVRGGQFERSSDGRVVDAQGLALLADNGEDLVVGEGRIEFLSNGTVLEDGLPIARLGVFQPGGETQIEAVGGTLFRASDAAMRRVETPAVRQGMLENANVDLSHEMVDMMSALRQAEIGARIVQAYDGLVGQSITTFGRTSR